jgi:hypothetical protein
MAFLIIPAADCQATPAPPIPPEPPRPGVPAPSPPSIARAERSRFSSSSPFSIPDSSETWRPRPRVGFCVHRRFAVAEAQRRNSGRRLAQ